MAHKITHREQGQGPLLVLLHGYGGSVMQWDAVVERLQSKYRVVALNLSHLYLSRNRLLFSVVTELIADYLRTHFPGEKASFAGASFGGSLAWAIALQSPELVDRLVLINPVMPHPVEKFRLPETRYFFVMPMGDQAILRLLGTPIGVSFLERASEIFRPDRARTKEAMTRMTRTKLGFFAEIIAHFSWILRNEDWNYWAAHLPRLSVPTGVLWAGDDQLFDPSTYRDFAMALRAHAEEISTGGHVLSRTRPEDVARFCEEFLAMDLSRLRSA